MPPDLQESAFYVGNVIGNHGRLYKLRNGQMKEKGDAFWDGCPSAQYVSPLFNEYGAWICKQDHCDAISKRPAHRIFRHKVTPDLPIQPGRNTPSEVADPAGHTIRQGKIRLGVSIFSKLQSGNIWPIQRKNFAQLQPYAWHSNR